MHTTLAPLSLRDRLIEQGIASIEAATRGEPAPRRPRLTFDLSDAQALADVEAAALALDRFEHTGRAA